MSFRDKTSFFMTITQKELRKAHGRYDEALLLKSKLLPDLDQWYRSDLRFIVKERRKGKDGAYLTSAELVKLMKWKLTVSVNRKTKSGNNVLIPEDCQ